MNKAILVLTLLLTACGAQTPSIPGLAESSAYVDPMAAPVLAQTSTLNPTAFYPASGASYGGNCAPNPATGTWANTTDPTDQLTFSGCKMTSTKCKTVISYAGDSWEQNNSSIPSWVFDYGIDTTECHAFAQPYQTNVRTFYFIKQAGQNTAQIGYRSAPLGYSNTYVKISN